MSFTIIFPNEAKPNKWGGNSRFLAVSIITPPLLTLNMRDTEEHGSGVKVNIDILEEQE